MKHMWGGDPAFGDSGAGFLLQKCCSKPLLCHHRYESRDIDPTNVESRIYDCKATMPPTFTVWQEWIPAPDSNVRLALPGNTVTKRGENETIHFSSLCRPRCWCCRVCSASPGPPCQTEGHRHLPTALTAVTSRGVVL